MPKKPSIWNHLETTHFKKVLPKSTLEPTGSSLYWFYILHTYHIYIVPFISICIIYFIYYPNLFIYILYYCPGKAAWGLGTWHQHDLPSTMSWLVTWLPLPSTSIIDIWQCFCLAFINMKTESILLLLSSFFPQDIQLRPSVTVVRIFLFQLIITMSRLSLLW